MVAVPDSPPDLLDRLLPEQRALLLALGACAGPARARDLADAAHVSRRSAGQRLEALTRLGLVLCEEGTGPILADHVHVYSLSDSGRHLLSIRNEIPKLGHTIHSTVLADRVRAPIARVQDEITRALGRAGEHLQASLAIEITRAYTAGVADGFAQGVAAEVASGARHAE